MPRWKFPTGNLQTDFPHRSATNRILTRPNPLLSFAASEKRFISFGHGVAVRYSIEYKSAGYRA